MTTWQIGIIIVGIQQKNQREMKYDETVPVRPKGKKTMNWTKRESLQKNSQTGHVQNDSAPTPRWLCWKTSKSTKTFELDFHLSPCPKIAFNEGSDHFH
jgi:hypothetical protein